MRGKSERERVTATADRAKVKSNKALAADSRAITALLKTGAEIVSACEGYKVAQVAWERVGVCSISCIKDAKEGLKRAGRRWNNAVAADRSATNELMRTSLCVIQAVEAYRIAKTAKQRLAAADLSDMAKVAMNEAWERDFIASALQVLRGS